MSSNTDEFIDRMHLKRQLNRWRVLAVVIVMLALVLVVESRFGGGTAVGKSGIGADYIARVTIDGIVMDERERIETLQEVKEDKKAKALIVWLDTPGGSVVGGEEIYHQLLAISKEKPVVAVMRSLAASAGYMIALGTDHIIAREGTMTGSIGVLLETAEITELVNKLGITPIIVKSAPLKGSPGFLEKATPEAVHSLENLIEDTYQMFVKMVADRRKMDMETAILLADGRVFTGRQALKLKLIDQLGGEEEALVWLQEKRQINKDLDIKDADKKEDKLAFLQELTETLSRNLFGSRISGLDGLRSIWQPSLQLQ